MASVEELARHCAEALVHVVGNGKREIIVGPARRDPDGGGPHWLGDESVLLQPYDGAEHASFDAQRLRGVLAIAFAAVIEEALRSVPVPSPVSAWRVAQIAEGWGGCPRGSEIGEVAAIQDLLADRAHLTRILQDVAQDGPGAALLRAAREEGWREILAALEEQFEAEQYQAKGNYIDRPLREARMALLRTFLARQDEAAGG